MLDCSTFLSALLLGVWFATGSGFAQSKPAATPPPAVKSAPVYDYSREAVVFDKLATVFDYNADGTGEKTLTFAARIQSDAAVRQLGVISIPYAADNEQPEIVYLRVRKKDGSVVETPPGDAQDMPSQISRIAPFYSDLKEKQIPVKSLSPGDSLEYEVRFHLIKPLAPGQFWGAENFSTNAVMLDQTVELRVPKDKYVLVLSPKAQPVIAEENGKKVYRWKTSHPEPTPIKEDKKNQPKPDADTQPTIAWTTFKNWGEVGAWFGGLARDRAAVTPELKAKADALTKGKTTDDEKIQAIYDYVSTQVRYIGVAFGIGRYQPHAAETVMDNQYGDCKDKHTLLAGLLKAAGYDAWPALISDSVKLNPDLPSPGQFDHVITVVPRGDKQIWLDSTPEISPYRMLIYPLRDKQALVIPDHAPASLMRTPADPPFPSVDAFESAGKLASDGTFTAHISLKLRGDTEIVYREIFHQTSRTQWNDVAQGISQGLGFGGTVSNLDVSIPEKTADPFQYSYDYTRKDFSDWANHRIQPPMLPLQLPDQDDEEKPSEDIPLSARRVETSHSVLELPAKYTAELPKPVKYATGFLSYQADYRIDGNKLITDRRIEVLQPKIPISSWSEYQEFIKNVRADRDQYIQLIGTDAPAEVSEKDDPIAEDMLQQAYAAFRRHDYNASRLAVDRAMKQNPQERGLWAEYGYIDIAENQFDDALAAFQKEVQMHPQYKRGYQGLVTIQMRLNQPDDAIHTLSQLLKVFPDDREVEERLSFLLMQRKKYEDASTVLLAAHNAEPNDANLALQSGAALILAGKTKEGEDIFRPALEKTTEAGTLNNTAYELADAGLGLDLAEAASRKALQLQEQKVSHITLQNLNNMDFRQVSLLINIWDTMGWTCFRKGDMAQAENYIKAAWVAGQSRGVGNHLGQVYEKEGRKKEAANIYALAAAAESSSSPDSANEIATRIDALKSQGVRASYLDAGQELGEERSVYLPKITKKYASAEFFIAIAPDHVEDAQFMRGDESLKPAVELLKKARFQEPFPSGSQGKLIRRGILVCSEIATKCQFTMLLPQSTTVN